MRFKCLLYLFLLFVPLGVSAQWEEPVHFKCTQQKVSPTEILLVFQGTIDKGWHVYSCDMPGGGPTVASFHLEDAKSIKPLGKLQAKGSVKETYDEMFSMNVKYMEGTALFHQRLKITGKEYEAHGYLEYGACNDQNCLPPTEVPFTVKGVADISKPEAKEDVARAAEKETMDAVEEVTKDTAHVSVNSGQTSLPVYWKPVTEELKALGDGTGGYSLWWVFLMGLLGGLIAVITPCVWPIIPMTISYFLKRYEQRGKGLRDALLYGVFIVLIYVGLGLLITWAFGSNGLNVLSTSAWFNLICFAILIVLAASFLGGFDLALPSSWGNRTDSAAERKGGVIGIFLMAVTLTIVSFSCTGPIIGFLLVDLTTSSNYMAPILGMLGFALALALPFTLFALFPSLIKKAPKSGNWMNTVKVVLGFIELAFSLKFLSVADMAYGWHILDREVFLSLWIVLFALLGVYLLGKLRFPADEPKEHCSVPGFFCGLISLAFAMYMVPGLWGAPLKAISAFAPPMSTQDFKVFPEDEVKAKFDNYDEAIAAAKMAGKPLLLDFTGYGCVNCRKMEAAVWTDPQIKKLLNDDFILVSLYVDDRTLLDVPLEVDADGKHLTLRTKGQLWSFLQSYKFGANTQPFYIPVDAQGQLLNYSYSYDEDVEKYKNFLQRALENNNIILIKDNEN